MSKGGKEEKKSFWKRLRYKKDKAATQDESNSDSPTIKAGAQGEDVRDAEPKKGNICIKGYHLGKPSLVCNMAPEVLIQQQITTTI